MRKEQAKDSDALVKTGNEMSPTKRSRYAGSVEPIVRESTFGMLLGSDGSRDTKLIKENFASESSALRDELAGPNPSTIERLLSERIATCSAMASVFDYQFVSCISGGKATASIEFWARESERAHNRLLKAVAVLAQVRKVQGPLLQVNIGEKQVNVAGSVTVSD